jgi:hypothetical protein
MLMIELVDIFSRKFYAKTNSFLFCSSDKIGSNTNKSYKNLKHIVFLDNNITFENIVYILSSLEDLHGSNVESISLKCNSNRKLFFDLIDFYYSYGLQVNIICDNIMTPFKIMHDIFSSSCVNNYHNYGLCIDLSNINGDIWFNETVLQTTKPYISCGFLEASKVFFLK